MDVNPVLLEIFKNRFSAIAEEMGVVLKRTAFSPNIKERRDYSCAIFDARGHMIAQAAHIPVHLGSMPMSVRAAMEISFSEGDMIALNDPFRGGTHLPDITLVAPVFLNGEKPAFYVANRAHHADVGGMSAGSMPLSSSIFQEGLIIPPLKIISRGRTDAGLMKFFLSNVRTPVEREGDFSAQAMANLTGIRRFRDLVQRYGFEITRQYAEALLDYSERMMRQAIESIPDGTYRFADVMEDDGFGAEDICIQATVQIEKDRAVVDFAGSAAQVAGCINAVSSIALSAVLYVFRCLMPEDAPTNAGCFRPIEIRSEPGTLVDALFPAAVAGGNVETSQRIVDVVLGALARVLPGHIPAASQGTMNNIAIGGVDPRSGRPFAYYETIGGGMGAGAFFHGESAVHSHMTNTRNTPVEALEYSYPFQVTRYAVRKGSGGSGLFCGGNGIIREIRLDCDAEVTVLSERRKRGPYGLYGAAAGKPGKNTIVRRGRMDARPSKFHERLQADDVIRIETPGGGGYGRAPSDV